MRKVEVLFLSLEDILSLNKDNCDPLRLVNIGCSCGSDGL